MDAVLTEQLVLRREQHLYRQRLNLETGCSPELEVEGKRYLAFCSNDYLGLAGHPAIAQAAQEALQQYGTGSGASHLISGHSYYHNELENRLAAFTGRQRAVLFSTGYMANLGVISALVGRNDLVLHDYLNHASLLDGGILSRAKFKRFSHVDMQALEQQLSASEAKRKLVVTDGVFSMDGDLAPLDQMSSLVSQRNGWLMVDDAHGFGVLGKKGGGLVEACNLSVDQVPVLVGTLGKAFGTFGAFVAGSEALIETLIQFSRSYIYTTALPPSIAAASLVSLEIVERESWRREKLNRLIAQFRKGAQQIGLQLMDSSTPIQPVLINDDQRVMTINSRLKEYGFLVGAIRPPTVPQGSGRLRITFSAEHTEEQVERLLDALDKVVGSR